MINRIFNLIFDKRIGEANAFVKSPVKSGNLNFFYEKDSLQWYMAFSSGRTNKAMPFDLAIVSSNRCSADIMGIIGKINTGCIEDVSDFFENKIGCSEIVRVHKDLLREINTVNSEDVINLIEKKITKAFGVLRNILVGINTRYSEDVINLIHEKIECSETISGLKNLLEEINTVNSEDAIDLIENKIGPSENISVFISSFISLIEKKIECNETIIIFKKILGKINTASSKDVSSLIKKKIECIETIRVLKGILGKIKKCTSNDEKEILFKEILIREILLKEFNVHRVMDKELIELALTENAKKRVSKPDPLGYSLSASALVLGGGSVIASASYIMTATAATTAFFGGGFLAMIPAGWVALATGTTAFSLGSSLSIEMLECHRKGIMYKHLEEETIERINAPELALGEFLVEIEPISEPSKIDSRVRVSKFMWAVTVITGPEGFSQNHACIVIEGLANVFFKKGLAKGLLTNPSHLVNIEDGAHFMFKSEFNPPVISGIYAESIYRDEHKKGMRRTQIWMRSSDKIIEMLKHIAGQKNVDYNKLGRYSDLAIGNDRIGGDSCYTWAAETIPMIGINLPRDHFEKTITWPRNFTRPFKDYENIPFSVQL